MREKLLKLLQKIKTGFGPWVKRNKKKLIVTAVMAVLLIVAFIGFKILVKVGSPKYFYNYLHDAAGSLDTVYNQAAAQNSEDNSCHAVPETSPEAYQVIQSIEKDGQIVSSYTRKDKIDFSPEALDSFKNLRGVYTFRGNYKRSLTSVKSSDLAEKKFNTNYWTYGTGKVLKNDGVSYWSGNGWTGQPLIIEWDDETRQHMNMFDSAKSKSGLQEVIYAGMDGFVHFLDLETGEQTRPDINVGMTFKGTATIYPDGKTPLLFCGSGDAQTGIFGENVSQRFYIYSLIDGTLLYQSGDNDDFAPRVWHAYDSSPVIDPVTDTLIYPGENGVIYTMKLNTVYDKSSGYIDVHPSEIVKFTFNIEERYSEGGRLWGSESSASVWSGYLYIGDNSGMLYCLDLNTMTMVWIQDIHQDINSSPILEIDERGHKYLYVGTTLKYDYNSHSMGNACIYKVNAVTGQIIWEKPYEVHTVKGYAGGVLSTGALGEGVVSDYIFYSVSKTPDIEGGYLVALNKENGEEAWRIDLDMYSWSSTVLTYTISGNAYIIQGCQNGDLLLIDAKTGEILDRLNFGSAIEATPAIYGNRLVFGVRNERIIGVELK